jgi:hypothetical protein
MTRGVAEKGARWSMEVLDSWDPDAPEYVASALSEAAVELFHACCAALGAPDVYWCPNTAEVTVEVRENSNGSGWHRRYDVDLDLNDLRDQAISDVWDAVQGIETPASKSVSLAIRKRLLVTTGAPGNENAQVMDMPGTFYGDPLTPKMAERAARIAVGHRDGVTVWDIHEARGYRLYRNSSRALDDNGG